MDFGFQKVEEYIDFCIYNSQNKQDRRIFKSMVLNKDKYKLTTLNKIKEDINYFLQEKFLENIDSYGDTYKNKQLQY